MEDLIIEDAFYEDLIIQYLSDTISDNDLLKLNQWLEENPKNKNYFERAREIWLFSKVVDNPNNFDSQKGFQHFIEAAKTVTLNKQKKHRKKIYLSAMRYAAVFIIALGFGLLGKMTIDQVMFGKVVDFKQEVSVPYGSKSTLTLSDGTVVVLNAGSKLSYSRNYGRRNREVWLEGEGHFSVAKDKMRPFVVKTEDLVVQAFGTVFNVKAYKDDKEIQATLIEGSVGVSPVMKGNSEKIMLKPNQQAVFNKKSSEIVVRKVDVGVYTGWRDDKFYFENESFSSIIKRIERDFSVTIQIVTPDLIDEKFSGSIDKRKPVDQVLKGMSQYVNFTFSQINDTIIIERK